jgi:hypothetical protein
MKAPLGNMQILSFLTFINCHGPLETHKRERNSKEIICKVRQGFQKEEDTISKGNEKKSL